MSIYKKKTQEQKADGSYVTVTAEFRKYPNVDDPIADHSAYLLGAKNGEKFRYDGLKGCSDYKKAVQIIKDGGYATSLTYVEKLCSIIEKWKLTQYDVTAENSDVTKYYRVRKGWGDVASQLGAYSVFDNAKAMADKHPGYKVYDWNGKQIYPAVMSGAVGGMSNVDCPFTVKVSVPDLNIRKGAGTDTAKTGKFTGVGVFTIVQVKSGSGSTLGCFQWSDEEYDLHHVKEGLADVLVYSQNLLDKLELDADEIISMKMSQNEAKYPVEKAKGSAVKYNQL